MKWVPLWLLFLCAAPIRAAPEWSIQIGEGQVPPPLDPFDAAWAGVPASEVRLYPQVTIPGGPGGAPISLEVRLLRGGGRLAMRLAWPDATEDRMDSRATHRFADAVAVQFAPPDAPLPYVGMGEPGRAVGLWFWRAGGPVEYLSAQGFGSLARQAGPVPEARAQRTATGWAVVLRGESEPAAAMAFAAWDGAEDGRAGRKRLSAWRNIGQGGSWLEETSTTGDPVRGARLFAEHGCATCHAPGTGLGPDLTYAGGIHGPAYLRRAIREPAAHLVPGYAAIMPVMSLATGEAEDLVAYLMTLN